MGMMEILDVARFFLSKSVPKTERAITHLKLQKLVYYAEAFYLAFDCDKKFKKDLFDEALQAWTHGPVSPKIYNVFQGNKNRFEELAPYDGNVSVPETYLADILNSVWDIYGAFSGSQLEYFTHREDPWIKAREKAGVEAWEPSTEIIQRDDMRIYYKKTLGLQ